MGAAKNQLNKEQLTISRKGWMLWVVMIVCPLADLKYKFAHMLISYYESKFIKMTFKLISVYL